VLHFYFDGKAEHVGPFAGSKESKTGKVSGFRSLKADEIELKNCPSDPKCNADQPYRCKQKLSD
jgi:hypothetical protein